MTLLEPNLSIELALFVLIGLVFLQYAGFAKQFSKGLNYAVGAVMFFFLDAATTMGVWSLSFAQGFTGILSQLWTTLGWLMLVMAAVTIAKDIMNK